MSQNLASFASHKGTITISDLELASTILQHEVTAANTDVSDSTIMAVGTAW
jgi:hypothetical protein